MTWLRRDDLPRNQRQILQVELANIAPSFDQSRIQRATERRSTKIQQALAPDARDANDQMIKAAKLVDNIAPIPGRPGFFSLMHGNELIELQASEVEGIRKSVKEHFMQAVNKIRGRTQAAKWKYDYQKEVNKDQPVVSFFVHTFGSIDDPGAELLQASNGPWSFLRMYSLMWRRVTLKKRQDLWYWQASPVQRPACWRTLIRMRSSAQRKRRLLFWSNSNISFGIAIGIGAAVAAPIVFGGAAALAGGAGLTGTVATGAAALGTGGVVIGGGAATGGLLRGGTNLAAAITGDVNLSEVKKEFVTGAKRGAVDAATGVVTAGTGSALGQGVTTTARIAKGTVSGFAGGFAGGGLQATLEGKSAGEVLKSASKSGLSGALGGGLGGAASKALNSQSAVTRVLTGSATGGVGGAAGTLITGGSVDEINQAGITGLITGGVTAAPAPVARSGRVGTGSPGVRIEEPDVASGTQGKSPAVGQEVPTQQSQSKEQTTEMPKPPSLRERQRVAALQREAIAKEAEASSLESKAARIGSTNPDRATRLRQRATQAREKSQRFKREAQEFSSGQRSPTEDLPGPEDIEQLFKQAEPEGKITGPKEVPPRLAELDPQQLPRLIRPLERGPNGGRIVYRVEGGGSKELVAITDGQVSLGSEKGAFLNFGSRARAEEFLQKRGSGSRIVAFEIDEQWVQSLRSAAIPEQGNKNISGPKLVDVRFADDQIYVPPELLPELQHFIVPGSGRVIKSK